MCFALAEYILPPYPTHSYQEIRADGPKPNGYGSRPQARNITGSAGVMPETALPFH